MKVLFSAFLLTRPSVSLAFTPGPTFSTAQTRTHALGMGWPTYVETDTKKKGGFTSKFFRDKADDADVHDEKESLLSRIEKKTISEAKEMGANLLEKTEAEAKVDWEVKADGIFGFVPTKEMTGVEPEMSRLCATISSQLYTKASEDEFILSTKDQKTEAFIYDDHGAFGDATPPFLAAITGDTMILGWRGTSSLADDLNDVACSPQSSLAWRKHAETIKAHGAFTSIVHNDIANHEESIIKKIKESGIKEIITTGQSLGGGVAQVAHLTLRAQIEDETSPWSALQGVNVRSVAFCGPMTTVLLDNASPETDAFLEKLWDNSCNFVYKNDVVPRGYGYLSFIEDFVDNAQGDLIKKIPMNRILKKILDFQGKLENLVDSTKENESLSGLLGVLSQYIHMGNLIYYESEDAKPLVLKDMGAFYNNTKKETDLFRCIKYKDVGDPLDQFMGWHMDIISYPEDELY
uniref:Fungal lipase-type domain-containing protein n=1 Tax=Attheya septentrionalis TaxID=420275 RepID=A0A7S2URJ2_9STRA|mmetsp:Transcript_9397/g.17025  ORF Transcript_9397/g.17025 Transcript_9397/m.17025 type:complete len:463 (+) Transcript_9397:74-1462(+)